MKFKKRFIDRLEIKFERYAIHGLMLYIGVMNLVIFAFVYGDKTEKLLDRLILYPDLVLKGEVWRLITFILIPQHFSLLWILFTVYFYYFIGQGLEHEWGVFKFNLYYFTGILGIILASFITGYAASSFYLNLSLFLAFAYLFPKYELLVFFILPIQIKFLAYIDLAYLTYTFIFGNAASKVYIALALANCLLFFGKDIYIRIFKRKQIKQHRKEFEKMIMEGVYIHKCAICGKTEKDDPNLEFRYCSKCVGDIEYCAEHIRKHEHKKRFQTE